jgi:hypothetical protein
VSKKAELVEVEVSLPGVAGKWLANETQAKAAWSMYVEIATRVTLQPIGDGQGLVRESLESLHSLFAETRRILREFGPDCARPADSNGLSFGSVAVGILNVEVRPFLARWHPALEKHEAARSQGASIHDHESSWPQRREFADDLARLQDVLSTYAGLLARIAGVARIHDVAATRPRNYKVSHDS